MTVAKSELRSAAIHEVGCKLDDVLSSSRLDVARLDGAGEALSLAASRISVVYSEIDKATVPDGSLDLETASAAKRYVTRCVEFLQKASEDALRSKFRAEGKVLGLEQSVVVAKSFYDVELTKKERLSSSKPSPIAAKRSKKKA